MAPQQRGFAANRHSDHYALLNAFQQWNSIRNRRGPDAEYEFCQQRLLSLPSLKMTSDAKVFAQVLNVLWKVLFICYLTSVHAIKMSILLASKSVLATQ